MNRAEQPTAGVATPFWRAAWRHMRALWPRWTLLPAAPFVLWGAYALSGGEMRWEIIALMIVAPALAYGSHKTKALMIGIYPVGLVGLLYDSMRFVKNVGLTPERVHSCDLHDLDARVVGLHDASGAPVALPDWFRAHTSTELDLLCAIPYGTFIFIALGYAVYLYLHHRDGMMRFTWTFLVVNVMGFVTYHIYPAAPPWYFHAHHCAIDLAAHASEGPSLAHVDALLGVKYFAGMYGRSNDIFGAMPSLHVAYPMAILLEAWRHHKWLGRALAASFLALMTFSAVYLDHHWLLDVVAGYVYTLVAYAIVSSVMASRGRRETGAVLAAAGVPPLEREESAR